MKLQIDSQVASNITLNKYIEKIHRKLHELNKKNVLYIEQVFDPIYYDGEWIATNYSSFNIVDISRFALRADELFDKLVGALSRGTTIDPLYLYCQERDFTTIILINALCISEMIQGKLSEGISEVSFWGSDDAANIARNIARKNNLKFKRELNLLRLLTFYKHFLRLIPVAFSKSIVHSKLVKIRDVGEEKPNILVYASRDTGLINGINLGLGIEDYNLWCFTFEPASYHLLDKYETYRIWQKSKVSFQFKRKASYKAEISGIASLFEESGLKSIISSIVKSVIRNLSLFHSQRIIFDEIFEITHPDVILVDDSACHPRRLLVDYANRLGTLTIQVGESGYYDESLYRMSAKHIVINQYEVHSQVLSSFLEGKNLIVASSPRYNELWKSKSSFNPKEAKNKLGLNPNHRLFLFCGSPGTGPSTLLNKVKYEYLLFRNINLKPDEHLIVKLHPQDDGRISRSLIKQTGLKNVRVLKNIPINLLLEAADLYLGTTSTLNIDAGILGIPEILIDFDDTDYRKRLVDNKLIWRCTSATELRTMIDEVLNKGNYPQDLFFEKIVKPEADNSDIVEKVKEVIAEHISHSC